MRTIKFRAICLGMWEYGSYVHFDKRPIDPSYTTQYCDYIVRTYELGEKHAPITKIETLSQFTGFYDKTGKEIYEGDILRCDEVPNKILKVYWNDEIAAFCLTDDINKEHGYADTAGYILQKYSCEVIGNIYDKPESLKEEDQCTKNIAKIIRFLSFTFVFSLAMLFMLLTVAGFTANNVFGFIILCLWFVGFTGFLIYKHDKLDI